MSQQSEEDNTSAMFEKVVDEDEEQEDEEDDDELSEMSEVESVAESIKEGIPESLEEVFASKQVATRYDNKVKAASLFTKSKAEQISSQNIDEAKRRKAEELFMKHSLFASGQVQANAKQIKPINSDKLDQKERKKQREQDTGKSWGYMPKVELTEELKMDLKAIQMRNQIFPKRFYKNNDSKKLPEYFQIGTVIDDGSVASRVNRLTKKD